MFKYTKRLLSDIRFWSQECKLRRKEDAEWDKIESEAEGGLRHHMAGFAFYATLQKNRAERKRLHQEERAAII